MIYYFMIVLVFLFMGTPAYSQVDDGGSQEQKNQEEQKHYLYQWTDSKGVVHITDSLSKVPTENRAGAQRLESSPGTEGTANQPGRQGITSPSDSSQREGLSEYQKEDWQNRMKTAKEKLADAEQRYQDLAQKRDLLLGSWGGPASGHIAGREEASRIEQQMEQVQKEINDARNQIEVVIPDEARKAGVPPGWLRE